jgi:hypothetical protein
MPEKIDWICRNDNQPANPVPNMSIDCKFRNGRIVENVESREMDWSVYHGNWDIVEYRIRDK